MSNAVNTDKYRLHTKKLMPFFCDENRTDTKFIEIKGDSKKYRISVHHYSWKIGEYHYRGTEGFLYESDVFRTKWYCFNDSSVFYQLISHKNEREYLIFRQELYGYSVLDIESGQIMQFYPKCSFEGMETFIWTQVHYHPENNVLAVEGCYWACPYSVQLFSFENPMNENPKFVDIISLLDGDYDVYDELEFLKWEEGNLHLKAFLVDNSKTMEIVIPKEQYLCWLGDDKITKYL